MIFRTTIRSLALLLCAAAPFAAPAQVIGTSPELDIALLQCDAGGMQPAPLGTAEDLLVGEWLVAVGYPVGGRGVTAESRFRPTVTVGVVSALERSFTPSTRRQTRAQLYYPDMIQTDAAINPGNSGGPLANASGEIVGINTFILTDSGGSQGLGFAIPIERALQAAADLRRNDVILDVDGKPVYAFEDAELALVPRFVGDRVTLGVWRDGRRIELQMVLTEVHDRR